MNEISQKRINEYDPSEFYTPKLNMEILDILFEDVNENEKVITSVS